jgi:transcriptional regulator with XRE-family HTH domain
MPGNRIFRGVLGSLFFARCSTICRERYQLGNTNAIPNYKIFVRAFSDNLKALRGDIPQAQFAKILNIPNQVTYHRYEHGRVPKRDLLAKIAKAIGATVDELISPMRPQRAAEIRAGLKKRMAEEPLTREDKIAAEDAISKSLMELVTPDSRAAIAAAFRLADMSTDEQLNLFDPFMRARNRAPLEYQKYYVLIMAAFLPEFDKSLNHKGKGPNGGDATF